MPRCTYSDDCAFFHTSIGFSSELYEQLRSRYCLGDEADCWRRKARIQLGAHRVPVDMMPTDLDIYMRAIAEHSPE